MSQQKIGRNAPCGSGKKYKQCCQANAGQTGHQNHLHAESIPKAMQAAWLYFQHGRQTQAETLCHLIIRHKPTHTYALHLLGASFYCMIQEFIYE